MDIIGISLLVILAVVVVVLAISAIVYYGWLQEPHLDSFSVGPRVWCPQGSCPLVMAYTLTNVPWTATVRCVIALGEDAEFGPNSDTIVSTAADANFELTSTDEPFATNGGGTFYTIRLFVNEHIMAQATTLLLPENPAKFDLVREVSQEVQESVAGVPVHEVDLVVFLGSAFGDNLKFPESLDICNKGVLLTRVTYLDQPEGAGEGFTDLTQLTIHDSPEHQKVVAFLRDVPTGGSIELKPPLLIGSEVGLVSLFQVRPDTLPSYGPGTIVTFRVAFTLQCAN